jgi:hypothetical protein
MTAAELMDEAEVIKELIRGEFYAKRKFSADDVYSHPSDPPDLSMYAALGDLVDLGELRYLGPEYPTKHTEMLYEVCKK